MEVLINFVESLYFYLILLFFLNLYTQYLRNHFVCFDKMLDRIQNIRIHLWHIWF